MGRKKKTILRSKLKKGSVAASLYMQCAANLESKMYGSLDIDELVDRDRTTMFLPHIFPQGAPHMKYQRVTLSPDVPITGLAMKLWTSGRFFLKHLLTDERLWFG